MIGTRHFGVPPSLEKLRELGDREMAEARQAVADARRLADETRAVRQETERLHRGLHGIALPQDA